MLALVDNGHLILNIINLASESTRDITEELLHFKVIFTVSLLTVFMAEEEKIFGSSAVRKNLWLLTKECKNHTIWGENFNFFPLSFVKKRDTA